MWGVRADMSTKKPGKPATSPDTAPPATEAVAPPIDPRLAALALIPHSSFILTSAFGEIRAGVVVHWVQQVSSTPMLVVVAIEKGQPLSPVIRDSRRFALCQLDNDDRVLRRMFEGERADPYTRHEVFDPFLGIATMTTAGGVPVPLKSLAWLDCELSRHLDVEGNCELYIGLVHSGGVLRPMSDAQVPVAARAPGSAVPGRVEASTIRPIQPLNGHANGHAGPRSTNDATHGAKRRA